MASQRKRNRACRDTSERSSPHEQLQCNETTAEHELRHALGSDGLNARAALLRPSLRDREDRAVSIRDAGAKQDRALRGGASGGNTSGRVAGPWTTAQPVRLVPAGEVLFEREGWRPVQGDALKSSQSTTSGSPSTHAHCVGGAAAVLEWLEEWLQTEWPQLSVRCTSVTDHWATVALVGPISREVLALLAPELPVDNERFPFMTWRDTRLAGVDGRVCRISFSGELARIATRRMNRRRRSSADLRRYRWSSRSFGAAGETRWA